MTPEPASRPESIIRAFLKNAPVTTGWINQNRTGALEALDSLVEERDRPDILDMFVNGGDVPGGEHAEPLLWLIGDVLDLDEADEYAVSEIIRRQNLAVRGGAE